MPLRHREAEQPTRFVQVLGSAESVVQHEAKHVLRIDIPLRCSKAIEPSRFVQVLGPTLSCAVHAAKRALRGGMPPRPARPQSRRDSSWS